jgi:hypothetical protein
LSAPAGISAERSCCALAGTVTKKLAKWLGVHGYLDENAVEDAVDRRAAAARDLPNAEKLSGLLFEQARKSMIDAQTLDDDDYVEAYLRSVRSKSRRPRPT